MELYREDYAMATYYYTRRFTYSTMAASQIQPIRFFGHQLMYYLSYFVTGFSLLLTVCTKMMRNPLLYLYDQHPKLHLTKNVVQNAPRNLKILLQNSRHLVIRTFGHLDKHRNTIIFKRTDSYRTVRV